MAGSIYTLDKFIKKSFGIQVAVRSSSDVDEICRKNGLSFCELLQPFSQAVSESHLHDPQGRLYTVRDLHMKFRDPNVEMPSSGKLNELLHSSVRWCGNKLLDDCFEEPMITINNVKASASTPWFNHFCETFVDNISVMEHENVRHFVAVVLVVSSRLHHPIESIQKLYKLQKESEFGTSSYWIPSPHIFYYHVLIHDVMDGNHKHARECFDVLKRTYGSGSCYFLPINSIDPNSPSNPAVPEPWSDGLRIPQESVDFSLPKLKRVSKTSPSLKKSTSNPNSPKVEYTEPEPMAGLQTEPELSSNSSTSIVSSQVEFGADPLSESDVGEIEFVVRRIGGCMSLEDQNNLQAFIKEFSNRLLSHLEAVLRKINDSLQSRRTMSRRMSSFSRGFLWKVMGGGISTGNAGVVTGTSGTVSTSSDALNLSADTIEGQMRLVGDLAFLLHNYEVAYNMYHTVKRDLQGRDLWIHYAGAHEMAALSAQMNGQSRKEIQSYLEEAYAIYTSQLKLPDHALRTSIFLCEILKSRGKYRELVSFFVKQISNESDLHTALWLEQSAHAFLKHQPVPMIRKYALHLVLAANHFSKAGQINHAIHAYRLALPLYDGKNCVTAESFLNFILAKLCVTHERQIEALQYLVKLLGSHNNQSIEQQLTSLKSYLTIEKAKSSQESVTVNEFWTPEGGSLGFNSLTTLPTPLILPHSTSVVFENGFIDSERSVASVNKLMGGMLCAIDALNRFSSLKDLFPLSNGVIGVGVEPYKPCHFSETEWQNLEMLCYSEEHESKSNVLFMEGGNDNSKNPFCQVNELVRVAIVMKNPLNIALQLKNVSLIWRHDPIASNNEDTYKKDPCAFCEVLEPFELAPNSDKKVWFRVIPTKIGDLVIEGLTLCLCAGLEENNGEYHKGLLSEGLQGQLKIQCRGLRLNRTKAEKSSILYGSDNRLSWRVVDQKPKAIFLIEELNEHINVSGEIIKLTIKVINCGPVPISKLSIVSTLRLCNSNCDSKVQSSSYFDTYLNKYWESPLCYSGKTPFYLSNECIDLPIPSGQLFPGDVQEHCLFLHMPEPSNRTWGIVTHCQTFPIENSILSYSVARHCEHLNVKQYFKFKGSLLSSPADSRNIVLSFTVDNNLDLLPDGPDILVLRQISVVCRDWRIAKLADKNMCNPIVSGLSGCLHVIFTKFNDVKKNVSFSDLCLDGESLLPLKDHSTSEILFSSVDDSFFWEKHCAKKQEAMIVFVFWKAIYKNKTRKAAYGYHRLKVPFSRDNGNMTVSTRDHNGSDVSVYPFVNCYLSSRASYVIHNFLKEGICTLWVDIKLENNVNKDMDVLLEFFSNDIQMGINGYEPPFNWSGPMKQYFTLPASSSHLQQISANITQAGVYNLGLLQVKSRCVEDKFGSYSMVSEVWNTSSCITVVCPI